MRKKRRRENATADHATAQHCPCCGGTLRIIEVFDAGSTPRHIIVPEGIDSS